MKEAPAKPGDTTRAPSALWVDLTSALMEIEDYLRTADGIKRSLGAPGDYGYDTPTGKALMGLAELTYRVGNNRAVACSILADLEKVLLIPLNLPLLDILAERQRQITKGRTLDHDDEHAGDGRLAIAGAAYALQAIEGPPDTEPRPELTTPREWTPPKVEAISREKMIKVLSSFSQNLSPCNHRKPLTPREQLVRAAACIVAEIERIDRTSIPTEG